MKYVKNGVLQTLCAVLLCSPVFAKDNNQPDIEFSGFGRLVAGILDDKGASHGGYTDKLSITEQSLVGVQLDARLSSEWSLTGQAIGHSQSSYHSGLEWLYLSYQPNNALRFKAGKLRTPMFSYSDIIRVGYAYHFISPPLQIYSSPYLSSYDGISANYNVSTPFFDTELDLYYGKFDEDITFNSSHIAVAINSFRGVALNLHKDNLKLRISAHTGNGNIDIPQFAAFDELLQQANYPRSADLLATSGEVNAYQLSLNYDTLDYFVRSEAIRLTTPIGNYPNKANSYYVSYGRIYYPFTLHLTYANIDTSFASAIKGIPAGLSPKIDSLVSSYQQVFDAMLQDDIERITLGLRWDFTPGMAAKVEWSHLRSEGGRRAPFNIHQATSDDRANLLQVAWEWVF